MTWQSILRLSASSLVVLASLFIAALVALWIHRFFPKDRLDMTRRSAYGDRVFTEVVGFRDLGIHLQAVDFPYTWWEPAMVGDLYWPQRFQSREVFWSGDHSVVAIRTVMVGDPQSYFTDAYDFRRHLLLHLDIRLAGSSDAGIRNLLESRGGVGDRVSGVMSEKGDRVPANFPAAGWIPPLLTLAAGLFFARRIWTHGLDVRVSAFRRLLAK